jgi:hypothetical protein
MVVKRERRLLNVERRTPMGTELLLSLLARLGPNMMMVFQSVVDGRWESTLRLNGVCRIFSHWRSRETKKRSEKLRNIWNATTPVSF